VRKGSDKFVKGRFDVDWWRRRRRKLFFGICAGGARPRTRARTDRGGGATPHPKLFDGVVR
jgi:hypothetical protein